MAWRGGRGASAASWAVSAERRKKPGTGPHRDESCEQPASSRRATQQRDCRSWGITYGRNLVSAVYRKLGAVDRADLIAKLEKG